jgi:sensor histidine kinase YesM
VYDLHQDKKGFIWIAGNSGVQRFDGRRFSTFSSLNRKSLSLAELQEDPWGRMWMHDFTDRIFFSTKDSLYTLNDFQSATGTFPTTFIHSNQLWVCTNEKLCRYTLHEWGAILKKTIPLINSRSAYVFNEELYSVTPTGVVKINNSYQQKRIVVQTPNGSSALTSWCSFFEINRVLYLLTLHDKTIYKLQGNQFVRQLTLAIPQDLIGIRKINQKFWVLTRAGVYCYDSSFRTSQLYLKHLPISDVIEDTDHSIWISTLTQGVFYIPNTSVRVYSNSEGFTAIHEDNSALLLGGIDGNIYSYQQDKIRVMHQTKKHKEVSFIYQSPFDYHYYWGNAFLSKTTGSKSVIEFASNPGAKQLHAVDSNWFLCSSSEGLMLMRKTLSVKTPPTNFPLIKHAVSLPTSGYFKYRLIPARTQQFYYNRNQNYLIASTKNGVYFLNKDENTLLTFNGKPIYATSVSGNGDSVWISTLSNGLLLFTSRGLISANAINKQLLSNQIQKIVYQNGHLLVIHQKGIQVFDLKSTTAYYFLQTDGIYSGKINDALVKEGFVYLANNHGLTRFPLSLTYAEVTEPKIYLSEVNNLSDWKNNSTLDIRGSNKLNIRYSLVCFKQKEWIKVQYKIEGYENDWTENNADINNITFSALPYGTYTVLIRAVNHTNGKSSAVIRLPIFVHLPFYRSIYFVIVIGFILLVIVWLLMQLRIKQLAKKNRELLEKERLNQELKSSMLASIKSQMNPHFIFNALNTIQGYVLQNDKLQANFYLGKFSDLMRKILSMSAKDRVKLEEEIDAIKLYLELENMRFNGSLNYELTILHEDELFEVEIPSMIIQPFVENAIKHGLLHKQGEKRLQIIFELHEERVLKVTVKDYGIGRQHAAKLKARSYKSIPSFSSEANKKRLELLNEQLKTKIGLQITDDYEGGYATGTTVIMYIPFQ